MARLRRPWKGPPSDCTSTVEPITRFLFEATSPSTWVRVPEHKYGVRVTLCDEDQVNLRLGKVEAANSTPYTVLNYDIETLGLDPCDQPVIQISMVFVTGG